MGAAPDIHSLKTTEGFVIYMLRDILHTRGQSMNKAQVFKCGNGHAVRIPRQFRFHVGVVEIFRRGHEIVLREPKSNLAEAFAALGALPEDFMADGRQDQIPRNRRYQ